MKEHSVKSNAAVGLTLHTVQAEYLLFSFLSCMWMYMCIHFGLNIFTGDLFEQILNALGIKHLM